MESKPEQVSQPRFVDTVECLGEWQPDTYPQITFRPFVANFGDHHAERQDMQLATKFLVRVGAERFGVECADEASFFPRFDEGGLAGCVPRVNLTFGHDPAPTAA